MSAQIFNWVILSPNWYKIEETIFLSPDPNVFVPFVLCHHLLAKAVAVALQKFLIAWMAMAIKPVIKPNLNLNWN